MLKGVYKQISRLKNKFQKLVDERATNALKCRYLHNYNVYILKICEKLTLTYIGILTSGGVAHCAHANWLSLADEVR